MTDDNVPDAWRLWTFEPPPRDEIEIEIKRGGSGKIYRVIPCLLQPEFNVHNLWWRPIVRDENFLSDIGEAIGDATDDAEGRLKHFPERLIEHLAKRSLAITRRR